MFGFLKDVGKDLMNDAMDPNSGQRRDGNQNPGAPPGQYGGYAPPPGGGYGPPQGGYAPPPGGGYGPPQGGYAPPPDGGYAPPPGEYGAPQGGYAPQPGGYGPPQGQYGGYGPPQGGYGGPQQGYQEKESGGLGGFIGGLIGGGGGDGQQQQQQQQRDGRSGGSGVNDLISGMASQYIGGMMSGQGGHQPSQSGGGGNDMISNIASSVIGNISSGGQDQNTMNKTGLDSNLISGIVSSVMSSISGNNTTQTTGSQGGGFSNELIAAAIPIVIKEILSQDTDGKILSSGDGKTNSGIISDIASNVVKQVVSGGHGRSQGGQGSGGGGFSTELLSGVASKYIGNMLSGGHHSQGGGGGGGSRSATDMLSGIASSILSAKGGSGGGSHNPGGAIASNIMGHLFKGPQMTRGEDGSIQTHLTQMQVDPSRKRVLPDSASTLISSFLNKGAYHLRNRFMKGGRSGHGDVINPAKAVFNFGEKGSGLRARGGVQNFYEIRDECLANGTLWEDPDFLAEDASIFFSRAPPKPFEWKRPTEVSEDPQLFVEGASRFDVKQGELGDCWLLAAIANLTLSKRLFYQIVPSDQSFGENYAGMFHFRFWQYGRWVDVVIDDRLPTFYGRLVFMHSDEKNEFWSALLEKAYAKLHGSYEALKGGTTCEAMEDFTGGVSEIYDLTKAPPNLFNIMLKAYERGSLMGCSVEPDPNELEARCDNGLVKGHAYSITRIKYCEIHTPRVNGKIPLIRIRNPWGNEAEWNGPWSDQSQEWQFIPQEEREEMGLNFEHDGEFWMSYQDFLTNFTLLEMTNLSPDSITEELVEGTTKHKWEMSVFEGAWVKGATAGGCRNFIQTFWHNPQYLITLTEVDDDDDDNKCTVIVALMQKNRRSQRKLGLECLTIGFAIYHLPDPDNVSRPLDLSFFKYNASVARSPSFINMREVSCRFKLPPGTYCIVPSTFEPQEEGEFILRVFSEKANDMEENDEEVGYGQVDDRVQTEDDADTEVVDDRVRGFFDNVAGEDLEIDWRELKGVLDFSMKKDIEFDFDGFGSEVIRSMVSMLDVDRSGKLGLQEFIRLWKNVRVWKNSFKLYDKDSSGHLNGFELREALNSSGYRLNNHILSALMLRYGDEEGNLSFDNYMMCSVKLKTLMASSADGELDPDRMADFYKKLFDEPQQTEEGEEEQEEAE